MRGVALPLLLVTRLNSRLRRVGGTCRTVIATAPKPYLIHLTIVLCSSSSKKKGYADSLLIILELSDFFLRPAGCDYVRTAGAYFAPETLPPGKLASTMPPGSSALSVRNRTLT